MQDADSAPLHAMWASVAAAWDEHADYVEARAAVVTERLLALAAAAPRRPRARARVRRRRRRAGRRRARRRPAARSSSPTSCPR